MITNHQHKQIEQWVCSPQYKQIEPQIVDGCVDFFKNYPKDDYSLAFTVICNGYITNEQTNFSVCRSIWKWVYLEICHKYGEDYYPKMIKLRQKQMAINTDF
jgi:hypothetical protein